jgi:phosphoenolpyruvate-protein phosphotransferase
MNLLLTVINPTGLHARPAALFTATAKKFRSIIRLRNLTKNSEWVDAKSVLGVLGIGAECSHEIEINIEGADAKEAADSLLLAIESGLGEEAASTRAKGASALPEQVPDKSTQTGERILEGIPGAPGIAVGSARLWNEKSISIPRRTGCDFAIESARLNSAREAARRDLESLQAKVAAEAGASESKIFEAHQMFLDDPTLLDVVENFLNQGLNAEAAWMDSVTEAAGTLNKLSDATLAARAADLKDVGGRVLNHLLGESLSAGLKLTQASIVIARDLTPSQTASLDKSLVLAFCTAEGGPTAHTVILARALQIPAVVGLGSGILSVSENETLIVNGSAGRVTRKPADSQILEAQKQKSGLEKASKSALASASEPAITKDGRRVEVVANVGSVEDSRKALEFGAEGVGLLRTEFLYLQREAAPTEDEQVEAYKTIFDVMRERPVVVRTLDIGGDKMLPYLDLPPEGNPFLGWRAIRICLERPDIFQPQLRALLRAAVGHDIRIMFPMIATLEEIRAAKAAVTEAREVLRSKGVAFAEKVQLGMMVEIPSAAIMAEAFAREVDFFSIGTNDLTQYTMAAERTNKHVAHLGDAIHPAVLRLIKQVTDAAHAAGRLAGICGELGGDAEAIPILLGLGVDELSMTPALIPQAKAIIRTWDIPSAGRLAEQALTLDTAEAVRVKVRSELNR